VGQENTLTIGRLCPDTMLDNKKKRRITSLSPALTKIYQLEHQKWLERNWK
jgi:hypothetical protein